MPTTTHDERRRRRRDNNDGDDDARFGIKRVLQSMGRTMRIGKNHDKFIQSIPHVVKHFIKFYRMAPPTPTCPSVSPECTAHLRDLLLMDSNNRFKGKLGQQQFSETTWHIDEVLKLLNYSLVCERLVHYCQGCCLDESDYLRKITYHLVWLASVSCPIFVPSRFTKIYSTPSWIAPHVCFCRIGCSAFEVAFKKDVAIAEKTVREAAAQDASNAGEEINHVVENSKRLVETADNLRRDETRFDIVEFLGIGHIFAPLLWAMFDSETASSPDLANERPRPPSSMHDCVLACREVQKAFRDALRPSSPHMKLLLALKSSNQTDGDVFTRVRADVFAFSTDVFERFDKRNLNWPVKASELLRTNITSEEVDELHGDFNATTICCMQDGLCPYVREQLAAMEAALRKRHFQVTFRKWAIYTRKATLNEERWHSFGKAEAAGERAWATDFARQAASMVLENHKRTYTDMSKRAPGISEELKAQLVQRVDAGSTMSRRRQRQQGFRVAPPLLTDRRKKTRKVEQRIWNLRPGGKPDFAYAAQKVKGRKFGSRAAYQHEVRRLRAEYAVLPADDQAEFVRAVDRANVAKAARALRRDALEVPPRTPWNIGDASWPQRPRLIAETLDRNLAAAEAAGADEYRWDKSDCKDAKQMLLKICDDSSFKRSGTMQVLSETYRRHEAVVAPQACWQKHYGLCVARDADIFFSAMVFVEMMKEFTKLVPKKLEGRPLIWFTSASYSLFAVQGKVSRNPHFQGYVVHAVEGKDEDAPGHASQLPTYKVANPNNYHRNNFSRHT